jgi:hypothetical protein
LLPSPDVTIRQRQDQSSQKIAAEAVEDKQPTPQKVELDLLKILQRQLDDLEAQERGTTEIA